jgi:predicted permease
MFSLVDGVLLAPLPYAQGDRIVHLHQEQPAIGDDDMDFSVHEIEDYRQGNHTLTDVVEYHGMTFTLLGQGDPELVATGVVSAHYFDVLGMKPILGRTFTEEDDRLGADPVMILSWEYWQNRFGGDPDVVGRGFVMNGKVHTVIGVLPPIPQFPDQNDVYMPTSQCPTRSNPDFIANRRARMMTVFGVLRPGVDVEAADRDLEALASTIADEHPDYYPESKGYEASITPLKEDLVANARPTLLILMGTTALVLLVACANVASLALGRAVKQGRELAVRQALGAGRGRLARQLLTESTVLALLGGAVGVVLARGSLDLLVKFAGRFTPRAFEATMDASVLGFALLISLATGLFFGSVPALRRAAGATAALGRSRTADTSPGGHRAHGWLVTAQVALAFVLLIGAGLLMRSFVAVSSVDPGYRPQQVLSARITLPMQYYMGQEPQDDRFFDQVLRRVRELPAVEDAARVQTLPLNGNTFRTGLETEATAGQGPDAFVPVMTIRSSPHYFSTLRIPVLSGRGLTEDDRALPERSVVLARNLTERLWPGQDPLDRQVRVCSYNSGQCGDWLTVVGVAGDVRMDGLEEEPTPTVYQADNSQAWGGADLVVRARGDLAPLGLTVASLVHELEPDAPVSDVRALDAYVSDQVAPRRLTALLMGIFAVLALVVTLAGVAGVVAFATSRRTHEIGVRMALGAEPGTVLGRILRLGMTPALAGLGVGALGAAALSRTLSHVVWGVASTDVVTYLGAGGLIFLGALVACWLPARKAVRVDPTVALRSE